MASASFLRSTPTFRSASTVTPSSLSSEVRAATVAAFFDPCEDFDWPLLAVAVDSTLLTEATSLAASWTSLEMRSSWVLIFAFLTTTFLTADASLSVSLTAADFVLAARFPRVRIVSCSSGIVQPSSAAAFFAFSTSRPSFLATFANGSVSLPFGSR